MPTREEQVDLIRSMITRAGVLLTEQENAYRSDLEGQHVSANARNLTHEVLEKCANVLDQAMTVFFEYEIKPLLDEMPKRGGYFPTARNEQSYLSSLGQWNAKGLRSFAPELDAKLRSLQPFENPANEILARLRDIANKKHTGLAPQKKLVDKRVTIDRPGGGSVSWGSGVIFGPGVSVMGVPIDPRTQRPVHTDGINTTEEKWISFHFEDGGEDALKFCRDSLQATSRAVKTLLGE